ncbi:glycosyltransferase [Fibrella sp. ES10-3-2-2]|nr:hypothetical protein A6C57_08725 [Fibrella sp. ES10-3-2-2]
MEQHKFTIIIPTRERADTLIHSLQTCTTQAYENLTILVSDNCGQDNTEQVVKSVGDPRVQYINTGERLSMAHNWEFALAQVNEGFVTILGDDDGFLPNAVQEANRILNETGLLAVNMNPLTDFYLWPSYYKKEQANMLKVSFSNGYEIRDGKAELRKLLACKQEHSPLACLYTSFIHVSAIQDVKRVAGSMFRSQIMDSYSAVALANQIGKYAYCRRKLRLNGISSHSTGSSQFNYEKNKQAADLFTKEAKIPFHSKLIYSPSYSYMIAENFMQSFDAGLNIEEKKLFDFMPFIKVALKEANTRLKGQYDTIIEATRYIAEHNDIDTRVVEQLISKTHSQKINLIGYDLKRYAHPFLFFNAANYDATNVYEAGNLYHDIRSKPARYLTKSTTWRYMFDMVFGETASRYKPAR